MPYCIFSGANCTVWFDDLSVSPIYYDRSKVTTLFDSNSGYIERGDGSFTGDFEKGNDSALSVRNVKLISKGKI